MTDPTFEFPDNDSELESDSAPEARAQRGARGAVVIGARIVTGLIGTGAALVILVAATVLPLPARSLAAPSVLVNPVAASQQRVCAGPLLELASSSGASATQSTSFGQPAVAAASTSSHVERSPLSSTDNSSKVAPALLTVPAARGDGSLFAGSQSQSAATSDIVGFAASECAPGEGDSWLVGGATSTGRTTLVTLSNPTEVASTATITIYSENGQVSSAGTEGIDVPAGGQRVFSLAAFAPGVDSPVVHVESRGGSIVANLQQSTVRTLQPGGVDIVDPSTAPGTLSVIPGVTILNSDAVFAQQGQAGYEDLLSVVRLLDTGTEAAHVQVSVIAEDSSAKAVAPAKVTVKAGIVTDVPLTGSFPDGRYTLTITSDQPVVAGARVSTVGSSGQDDFAWYSAAQALTGNNFVVVAPGPSPTASVSNAGGAPISVTVTSSQEAAVPVTLTVPAHSAVSTPVAPNVGYTVTSTSVFRLAVGYEGDGELSSFSVGSPAVASQPIRVYR
ncbi:MAG: hypothetical protein JWN80_2828 [Microbacteriaceae bacterium]|nr:hypothetical protein [Microbacteriaceae bacterium]